MPNCLIYGEIVFFAKPDKEQLLELSYNLMQKAIEYRFGLNLFCNLKEYLLKQYDISKCLNEAYIPYEILDSPLTNECDDIFDGMHIWGDGSIFKIEDSRLPVLQSFIKDVVELELISHMTIQFFDVHTDSGKPDFEYTIKANELCDNLVYLSNLPHRDEIPPVKFTIEKSDN